LARARGGWRERSARLLLPLKRTAQEENLQLALALAADAEVRKEPEKKSRFHRVSPRTAALVQIPDDWAEKPIDWADEVEEELPLVAESPDVIVEGDVITNGRLTNPQYHKDAKEAYELLCHWQQRVACGLENARSTIQEIYDLTQLSDWQGHFNGNWSLRRRFVGAITQYRRVVYRAHVLDELGAFDEAYGDRITWLQQRCRELLKILGLHLLVIMKGARGSRRLGVLRITFYLVNHLVPHQETTVWFA
jgi:hypothetical protein